MKKIKSDTNDSVKYYTRLRSSASFRKKENKALLFGRTMIEEAKLAPLALITTEPSYYTDSRIEVIEVLPSVMKKISGLSSEPSDIAVVSIPEPKTVCSPKKVLLLDEIQDPGNIGMLIRSAKAFGFDLVVFIEGSVDPYNDKVTRASRGMNFSIPLLQLAREDVLQKLQSWKLQTYCADASGNHFIEHSYAPPFALVLGNEGSGVSEEIKKRSLAISIPMASDVESLNVAAAGSILMHTMASS